MGKFLAILLNKKRTSRADLALYHKFATAFGLRVYFFNVDGLNLKDKKVRAYTFRSRMNLVAKMIPIPKVIHNQAIDVKLNGFRKVHKLRTRKNVILYNPICDYHWENIYLILKANPEIAPYLLLRKQNDEGDLVQEKIPILQYQDGPFFIHVGLQKDRYGKWSQSGIIGRVYDPLKSKMKSIPIWILKRELNLSEQKVNIMEKTAVKAALDLERFIPFLSESYFHFALAPDESIVLFYGGLQEKRNWYKAAGEISMWENTFRKPMEYGHYLLTRLNLRHL